MTREEALSKGVELCPTKPTMKRRCVMHDYSEPGIYMLTITVEGRRRLLGTLTGNTFATKESADAPRIVLSEVGRAVESVIQTIPKYHPEIEVWKYVIMEDHVHILVRVVRPMKKHLGKVVGAVKGACSRAYWGILGLPSEAQDLFLRGGDLGLGQGSALGLPAEAQDLFLRGGDSGLGQGATLGLPSEAQDPFLRGGDSGLGRGSALGLPAEAQDLFLQDGDSGLGQRNPHLCQGADGNAKSQDSAPTHRTPLFEEGYNDRILYHAKQLETLKRYIADNPRRLAVKRQFPQLFHKYLHVVIGSQDYAAYGNIFLLREAEKAQVQVHHKDTYEEHSEHMKQWHQVILNGGVLVSPFISPREREAREMARACEGNMIILKENGFPEIFKPMGWEFDYCASGHLLLLAPWPHHPENTTITRQQCLSLNAMANEICSLTTEPAWVKAISQFVV